MRRPPSVWVGHRGAVTSTANASDMHNTAHLRWEQLRPALSIHHRPINLEEEEEQEVYSRESEGGGEEKKGGRHIDEQSSRQMLSRGEGHLSWHKRQAWLFPLGLPIAKDRYLPPKAYTVLKV